MGEGLNETTKRSIAAAIMGLGPGGPIPVVVASNDYAQLLDNWLCHMSILGIERFLIVVMDDDLAGRLKGAHLSVARGEFDGSAADFWLQRARIWAYLVAEGVEFIHSDIDAVWLRDPVPEYADAKFDLLVSQGTIHPDDVLTAWGFVLCTGFFWARPTPASRRLFHALVMSAETIMKSDDQATLNRLLLSSGTIWTAGAAEAYNLQVRGGSFTCFREPVAGFCASLGLRLLLLPHDLFPRLQPGAPNAMVRHVLRNESPEQRISLMREAGCWQLDAHPRGFAIPLRVRPGTS